MVVNHNLLLEKLNYQFNDINLLYQALTHRSYHVNNNERLEYLGDAILGFVIAEALYLQFPSAREGELTRLRAHLVKGKSLAAIATEISLSDYLKLGPGELKSGAFQRESILEDALEALFGAIHLDGGLIAARQVILSLFEHTLGALSLEDTKRDPKSQLQEVLQARGLDLPVYTLLKTHGKDHEQTFYVSCEVSALSITTQATAKSRKLAEQEGARLALKQVSGKLTT